MTDPAPAAVHASVVVLGEDGILIEGASGAGKTSLALALAAEARRWNRFGRIVADDRALLSAAHGRLVARPHPAIAGLVERRGHGVGPEAHEPACVVRLVVGLVDREELPARVPDPLPTRTLRGVKLPMLCLWSGAGARENGWRVFDALMSRQDGA